MASSSSKDISLVREENIFPSLDLEVTLQDDHQNDSNSLRWKDIISEDIHHPTYNSIVPNTQGLAPVLGPITDEQLDEWINYGEDIPNSENQNSQAVPVQNSTNPTRRGRPRGSFSRKSYSREDISPHFYKPMEQAANDLGIGLTKLKRCCRQLGINRWPSQKLLSVQNMIRNVHEFGQTSNGEIDAESRERIIFLTNKLKEIEENPDLPLNPNLRKFRQSCNKSKHMKKRRQAEGTSIASAPFVVQENSMP